MAFEALAQAVETAVLGPWSFQRMETWPLAALTMSLGIVKAEIFDGPLSRRR